MRRDYRAYRRLYYFLKVLTLPFFRIRAVGREKIPEGAVLLCPNHSSNLDPVILGLACGIKNHLHFMGKVELFKIPLLSSVIRAVGSFPVTRGARDSEAVRTAIRYLQGGEKVVIFPEGRRVRSDEGGPVKTGAVRIADQAGAMVMPVYIPRKKRLFSTCTVVFGDPYRANPEGINLTHQDYVRLSNDLMRRIIGLKAQAVD